MAPARRSRATGAAKGLSRFLPDRGRCRSRNDPSEPGCRPAACRAVTAQARRCMNQPMRDRCILARFEQEDETCFGQRRSAAEEQPPKLRIKASQTRMNRACHILGCVITSGRLLLWPRELTRKIRSTQICGNLLFLAKG